MSYEGKGNKKMSVACFFVGFVKGTGYVGLIPLSSPLLGTRCAYCAVFQS